MINEAAVGMVTTVGVINYPHPVCHWILNHRPALYSGFLILTFLQLSYCSLQRNTNCWRLFAKQKISERSFMLELAAVSILVIPFIVGCVEEIASPVCCSHRWNAAARLEQTNSKQYNHFTLIPAARHCLPLSSRSDSRILFIFLKLIFEVYLKLI